MCMSGLEHKTRASMLSFTLLNICMCFGQSTNSCGVISRSHAIFLFCLHLFVLGMTKEIQQGVEKKKLKTSVFITTHQEW